MASDDIATLHRLAEGGDLAAAAYLAVLAAVGMGEPQSWPVAMARLGHAADLGSSHARWQLRVLSGRPQPEDRRWSDLAAEIDVAPWFEPAPLRSISADPQIAEATGFLPHPACRWLIGRAEPRLARAMMYDTDGRIVEGGKRANSAFEFAPQDLDLVVLLVRARIAATVKRPVAALETSQVLHYGTGEAFGPHFDFLDPTAPGLVDEMARVGQRIFTVLIYLNEGYEGGETQFPELDLAYKGKTGDALVFRNLTEGGAGDPRTLHAGLPPIQGEKWLLSQWVRER